MATLTGTVRIITLDGELVSETPPLELDGGGYETFSDAVEHAGSGVCVQLISAADGTVLAEELIED